MRKIIISGYYGFKNSGDDALLLSIIEDLKQRGLDDRVVVLSANPFETERIYGVKSVNRINPFSVLCQLLSARLLISGGGTLIQDGTSTKSLLYYLAIIMTARLLGTKVMLYSNGIGPLNRSSNQRITKYVLNRVQLITLRDKRSKEVLDEIGVTKPKIVITADPAFRIASSPRSMGMHLITNSGAPGDRRYLGIAIREWKTLPPDFTDMIAEAADYAAEKYDLYPIFMPMQPKKDYRICVNVMNKMKNQSAVINGDVSIYDMLSVVANMDICIGMRLHTLIYAAAMSVPIIGLVYDPKVSGFMEYAEQKIYHQVEELTVQKLCSSIDLCRKNYGKIKEKLNITRFDMQKKAALNGDYAAELFEKGSVSLE